MGTLVFVFLLLAIPFAVQRKGRDVSAQFLAFTLVFVGTTLFWLTWYKLDRASALDAALSPRLFVADDFDVVSAYRPLIPVVGDGFLISRYLVAITALVWLQRLLKAQFFPGTTRVLFWILAASVATLLLLYATSDLAWILFKAGSPGEAQFAGYPGNRAWTIYRATEPLQEAGAFTFTGATVILGGLFLHGMVARMRRGPAPMA